MSEQPVIITHPAWGVNIRPGRICFCVSMILAILAAFGVHFGPAALFPLAVAFLAAGWLLG